MAVHQVEGQVGVDAGEDHLHRYGDHDQDANGADELPPGKGGIRSACGATVWVGTAH